MEQPTVKKKDNITYKKENDDCSYIENCFGRSVISEQTLTKIEKELCTGSHTGCHLWFTDGKYITKEKYTKGISSFKRTVTAAG